MTLILSTGKRQRYCQLNHGSEYITLTSPGSGFEGEFLVGVYLWSC